MKKMLAGVMLSIGFTLRLALPQLLRRGLMLPAFALLFLLLVGGSAGVLTTVVPMDEVDKALANVTVEAVFSTPDEQKVFSDWSKDSSYQVKVVPTVGAGREELDRGALDYLVHVEHTIPQGHVVVEAAAEADRSAAIRRSLQSDFDDLYVEKTLGKMPRLQILHADGTKVGDVETGWDVFLRLQPLLKVYGGAGLVAFLGLLVGAGQGQKVAESPFAGFNQILLLGTSARTLYVADLFGILLVTVLSSFITLTLVGLVLVAVVVFGGPALLSAFGQATPVLLAMVGLAYFQAAGIGCVYKKLTEHSEKGIWHFLITTGVTLGVYALYRSAGTLFSDQLVLFTNFIPGIGLITCWKYYISSGASVVPFLILHTLYAVFFVELGARTFMLDESPLSWARRRV